MWSGHPSTAGPGPHPFVSHENTVFSGLPNAGARFSRKCGLPNKALRSIKHNVLCSPVSVAHDLFLYYINSQKIVGYRHRIAKSTVFYRAECLIW